MNKIEHSEKLYNEAIDFLEKNNIDKALENIKKAYKLNPDSLEITETLAILYNLTGDLDNAFKTYEIIIKKYPDYIYPYMNYLNLLIARDNMEKAYEVFDIVEKLIKEELHKNPRNKDLYIISTSIYYQMEFYDEAIMSLFNGLLNLPDDLDFLRELCIIYYELGIYDEAIKVCKYSLKHHKKEPTISLYLGLALHKMNYLKEALKYLKLSYKIDNKQHELKTLIKKIEEIIQYKGNTVEEIIYKSKAKKKYRGKVKWFDEEKGIGAIECPDFEDEIFVHYTAIKMQGFQTLSENMKVEFTIKKTDKGLIATSIQPENNNILDRFKGKVEAFDKKNGIGTVSGEHGEIFFHYSGIMDRLIKIIEPKTPVEYSVFSLDGYKQAFNIKEIKNNNINNKSVFSKNKKMSGTLKWFDKSVGYGIIESRDGLEIIIQKSSFSEIPQNLKAGTRVEFEIDEVEAITGEKIPRAVNIHVLK
ncbi:MAG: cold shock domain-containing protein [Candidatus Muiribacteriota bacterium]